MTEGRRLYVPPAFDSEAPLTDVEQALVRALAGIIVDQILDEARAPRDRQDGAAPGPTSDAPPLEHSRP